MVAEMANSLKEASVAATVLCAAMSAVGVATSAGGCSSSGGSNNNNGVDNGEGHDLGRFSSSGAGKRDGRAWVEVCGSGNELLRSLAGGAGRAAASAAASSSMCLGAPVARFGSSVRIGSSSGSSGSSSSKLVCGYDPPSAGELSWYTVEQRGKPGRVLIPNSYYPAHQFVSDERGPVQRSETDPRPTSVNSSPGTGGIPGANSTLKSGGNNNLASTARRGAGPSVGPSLVNRNPHSTLSAAGTAFASGMNPLPWGCGLGEASLVTKFEIPTGSDEYKVYLNLSMRQNVDVTLEGVELGGDPRADPTRRCMENPPRDRASSLPCSVWTLPKGFPNVGFYVSAYKSVEMKLCCGPQGMVITPLGHVPFYGYFVDGKKFCPRVLDRSPSGQRDASGRRRVMGASSSLCPQEFNLLISSIDFIAPKDVTLPGSDRWECIRFNARGDLLNFNDGYVYKASTEKAPSHKLPQFGVRCLGDRIIFYDGAQYLKTTERCTEGKDTMVDLWLQDQRVRHLNMRLFGDCTSAREPYAVCGASTFRTVPGRVFAYGCGTKPVALYDAARRPRDPKNALLCTGELSKEELQMLNSTRIEDLNMTLYHVDKSIAFTRDRRGPNNNSHILEGPGNLYAFSIVRGGETLTFRAVQSSQPEFYDQARRSGKFELQTHVSNWKIAYDPENVPVDAQILCAAERALVLDGKGHVTPLVGSTSSYASSNVVAAEKYQSDVKLKEQQLFASNTKKNEWLTLLPPQNDAGFVKEQRRGGVWAQFYTLTRQVLLHFGPGKRTQKYGDGPQKYGDGHQHQHHDDDDTTSTVTVERCDVEELIGQHSRTVFTIENGVCVFFKPVSKDPEFRRSTEYISDGYRMFTTDLTNLQIVGLAFSDNQRTEAFRVTGATDRALQHVVIHGERFKGPPANPLLAQDGGPVRRAPTGKQTVRVEGRDVVFTHVPASYEVTFGALCGAAGWPFKLGDVGGSNSGTLLAPGGSGTLTAGGSGSLTAGGSGSRMAGGGSSFGGSSSFSGSSSQRGTAAVLVCESSTPCVYDPNTGSIYVRVGAVEDCSDDRTALVSSEYVVGRDGALYRRVDCGTLPCEYAGLAALMEMSITGNVYPLGNGHSLVPVSVEAKEPAQMFFVVKGAPLGITLTEYDHVKSQQDVDIIPSGVPNVSIVGTGLKVSDVESSSVTTHSTRSPSGSLTTHSTRSPSGSLTRPQSPGGSLTTKSTTQRASLTGGKSPQGASLTGGNSPQGASLTGSLKKRSPSTVVQSCSTVTQGTIEGVIVGGKAYVLTDREGFILEASVVFITEGPTGVRYNLERRSRKNSLDSGSGGSSVGSGNSSRRSSLSSEKSLTRSRDNADPGNSRTGSRNSSLGSAGSGKISLGAAGSRKNSLGSAGSRNSLGSAGSRKNSLGSAGSRNSLGSAGSRKNSVGSAGSRKNSVGSAGSSLSSRSKSASYREIERESVVAISSGQQVTEEMLRNCELLHLGVTVIDWKTGRVFQRAVRQDSSLIKKDCIEENYVVLNGVLYMIDSRTVADVVSVESLLWSTSGPTTRGADNVTFARVQHSHGSLVAVEVGKATVVLDVVGEVSYSVREVPSDAVCIATDHPKVQIVFNSRGEVRPADCRVYKHNGVEQVSLTFQGKYHRSDGSFVRTGEGQIRGLVIGDQFLEFETHAASKYPGAVVRSAVVATQGRYLDPRTATLNWDVEVKNIGKVIVDLNASCVSDYFGEMDHTAEPTRKVDMFPLFAITLLKEAQEHEVMRMFAIRALNTCFLCWKLESGEVIAIDLPGLAAEKSIPVSREPETDTMLLKYFDGFVMLCASPSNGATSTSQSNGATSTSHLDTYSNAFYSVDVPSEPLGFVGVQGSCALKGPYRIASVLRVVNEKQSRDIILKQVDAARPSNKGTRQQAQ